MRLDLPAATCLLRAMHAPDHAASLSALEISLSVAFSASLMRTPPMPRNPPSLEASATCWLIWRSQPLKAAASPGALASTTAPACRSVSMHLALISPGLLPLNLSFRPSRAVLRPSEVSKSSTTALISASAPGSILAVISALPSAKLSFRSPHSPLGSAAETAIPPSSCPDSETREYHYGHRQRYREPNVTFAEPRRHVSSPHLFLALLAPKKAQEGGPGNSQKN